MAISAGSLGTPTPPPLRLPIPGEGEPAAARIPPLLTGAADLIGADILKPIISLIYRGKCGEISEVFCNFFYQDTAIE